MNKEKRLRKIVDILVKITNDFHNPKVDIVSELYDNKMTIDLLIGEEMLKIRKEEAKKANY